MLSAFLRCLIRLKLGQGNANTKIAQFHDPIPVDENILWFDVSMRYSFDLQMEQTLSTLKKRTFY